MGVTWFRWRKRLRWGLFVAAMVSGLSCVVVAYAHRTRPGRWPNRPLPKSGFPWFVLPWQTDRLPRPQRSVWFSVAEGILTIGVVWPLLHQAR